jgi:hypothetical protein
MQYKDSTKNNISMIVGITGHRDIFVEDEAELRRLISDQLQALQREFSNTPLLLLSGLAEGADRLVVQVAIELDIAFSAVLPMPQEEYCNDFETVESKQEFTQLLKSAKWVETLPSSANSNTSTRNDCYEHLGVYLARYSHVLMALWDGDSTEKAGGTSQVVRYFLSGIPPTFSPNIGSLVFPSYGKVIHFSTRRSTQSSLSKEVNVSVLWPDIYSNNKPEISIKLQENWQATLKQIDDFNSDVKQFYNSTGNINKIKESLSYLLGKDFQFDSLDKQAQSIAKLFAISDSMSQAAQVKRHADFLRLIILALIVIVCEQAYGVFVKWSLLAITISVGVLACLFYQHIQKQRLEFKYLDYRALAEALRIQFFWHISGVSANVADHFLRDQQDELEWIRLVIQSQELPVSPRLTTRKLQLDFIQERWIKDQRNYFIGDNLSNKGKYILNKQKNDELAFKMRLSFIFGIIVVSATLIFHLTIFDSLPADWRDYVLNSFIATYGVLFWIVPTIKLYSEFQSYDEQSKRYLRIGNYYALCEKQLLRIIQGNSDIKANDLLVEMGRQALIENSDWLQLHRQRPSQVPIL